MLSLKVPSQVILLVLSLMMTTGCGGGRLISRDVKDFMAAEFKSDRRNFDVTIPFKTTIIRRVPSMNLAAARESQQEFIVKFFEYARRDAVTNFENDTLLFLLRLDSNPDVNLKYHGVAADAREVVSGAMDENTFIERCIREENWSAELD